jgi:hypothetical protein
MQQTSLQKEWVRVALCSYCFDKFFNPLNKKAFNGESGYKTVPESSAGLIAVRFKFSR